MATDSQIGWTDDTVNGWWGCSKVSAACRLCYAEEWSGKKISHMTGGTMTGVWGKDAPRWLRVERAIKDLERSARRGKASGTPRFVFMHSMSDIMEARDDLVEPRAQLWEALHRICGEGHIVPLVLTKRVDVLLQWVKDYGWPAGAWAGVSAENQGCADERMPVLQQVSQEVRAQEGRSARGLPVTFASCEGLLGATRLAPYLQGEHGLRWVIVGGESGSPLSTATLPSWARMVRDDCVRADVDFFFKQWGTWVDERQLQPGTRGPAAEVRRVIDADGVPLVLCRWPADKKVTGDLLDGARWNQRPQPRLAA